MNYYLCKSPVTGQFKEASLNIQIIVTTHVQLCPALTMGGFQDETDRLKCFLVIQALEKKKKKKKKELKFFSET